MRMRVGGKGLIIGMLVITIIHVAESHNICLDTVHIIARI